MKPSGSGDENGKKAGRLFQVVRHCRRVRHNPFNPAVLQPPKGVNFFSHQGYSFWRYCGVNILTIRRFYGFLRSLRPVVEAVEDGGEFELSNTTNFRLRWIQGVRRTYFH